MTSPAAKQTPSVKRNPVRRRSIRNHASRPGEAHQQALDTNHTQEDSKTRKRTGNQRVISNDPREKAIANQGSKFRQDWDPDEVNAANLEYVEPPPTREAFEEHEETVEGPEDARLVAEKSSKEQRKSETTKGNSASGSGSGSYFQRGKNAASRISGFTGTVRDLGNRARTAESQGAFDNIHYGIRGVTNKFKPDKRSVASKLKEKIPSNLTNLSELRGLEVSEEGQIIDDDDNAVGKLVEGDPSDLAGQVVGEDGEILDEDGDLIGRVELISGQPATQTEAVKESVDTDNVPSLKDLANLPVLEDGSVKDQDGRVLGLLVEGDPNDLVSRTVDENGDILDEDGDLIGRVKPIPPEHVAESVGEPEPTDSVLLPGVAILRGRKINENGKILNDEGEDLGQVVEGQDSRRLSGKIPNELGQVMDINGEVTGQVEPVPGEAANIAMQELEDEESPLKKKGGLTDVETGEEEYTDANERPEISQELPSVSTLEGLKCNKFGYIVGENGVPVSELIEGNPKEISKGELQLDDRGRFCDNRGNILGIAQSIPIGEEDQRPFAGFEDFVVVKDGWVEDASGARVGQVVHGEIKKLLGRAVDDDGDILDKQGNLIGHADPLEEPEPEAEEVDFSLLEGLSPNKLGFVIGHDGAVLGRVTEGVGKRYREVKRARGGII